MTCVAQNTRKKQKMDCVQTVYIGKNTLRAVNATEESTANVWNAMIATQNVPVKRVEVAI